MVINSTDPIWWKSNFRNVDCDSIARETVFLQRRRKLTPYGIITAFAAMAAHSTPSLSAIAIIFSSIGKKVITKQAIAKRTTREMADFFKAVLATFTSRALSDSSNTLRTAFKDFPRVLVQDSTCISFPPLLRDRYPGGKNNLGQPVATLKIQTTLNLKTERFLSMDLMPLSRNEQAASVDILPLLKAGDLLIRDLGYWVLNVFKTICEQGAFFISRYRHDIVLFQTDSNNRFNLVQHLKRRGDLDTILKVGAQQKLPMRVIAIPLSEQVAEKRRRELKQNRDRRLNPSKDRLFLCGWALFVTNVDNTLTSEQIAHIYGLRWRIEIIFKSWKSKMGLSKINKCCSAFYTECIVMTRLLLILFMHGNIWVPLISKLMNRQNSNYPLSILKIFDMINTILISSPFVGSVQNSVIEMIAIKFCCYDKRKRQNYLNKLKNFPSY